ncbi:MAG: hypothetical protein WDA08_08025 [Weeksellaceae bacterium]
MKGYFRGAKYFLNFSFFLFNVIIYSQEVQWQKEIKTNNQDILSVLKYTVDQQILLGGSIINRPSESMNHGYDYHVIKLSQEGNVIWEKTYGGSGHDYLNSLAILSEGGYILGGTSFSPLPKDKIQNNFGGSDGWLIKIDNEGEEIWQKKIGTANNDEISKVVQTNNGKLIVTGNIKSNRTSYGIKEIFVSKLNQNGELIRTVIIGGNSDNEVTNMIPTHDGGVALLIYSDSQEIDEQINYSYFTQNEGNYDLISTAETYISKEDKGFGKGDYWIVKLDKDMIVEWQKI